MRSDKAATTGDETRHVLWLAAGAVFLILVLAVFAAPASDRDRTPSAENPGPHGAKAAYLLLPRIGYRVEEWKQPLGGLAGVDAAHTTVVLADPDSMEEEGLKTGRDALAAFLRRGGRVLATGASGGMLLPGGAVGFPKQFQGALCSTRGVGGSELARTGAVPIESTVAWQGEEGGKASPAHPANEEILQRCGQDAVVVRLSVGSGEALWWAGPTPLSNRGLHDDPSLRLLLLSLGETSRQEPRTVFFDEYVHGDRQEAASLLSGLPLRRLGLQACFVGLLLLFSFSRRFGPVRAPATVGRTSPLEFAWSMGALYEKAGATGAPIRAARRRLVHLLTHGCSVPSRLFSPEHAGALADYLSRRLGSGRWTALEQDMQRAADFEHERASKREALVLVQALDAHREAIEKRLHGSHMPVPATAQQTTKGRSA